MCLICNSIKRIYFIPLAHHGANVQEMLIAGIITDTLHQRLYVKYPPLTLLIVQY